MYTTNLAPAASEEEIRVDVLLSHLLGNVEAEGTISVIDAAFSCVVQNAVCMVDFLKLNITNLLHDFQSEELKSLYKMLSSIGASVVSNAGV